MKPFLSVLLFIFAGCGTETVKPAPNFKEDTSYHLFKNDITGEFYLRQGRQRGHFFFYDVVISGDSITCMNYIKAERDEKRREAEEREREFKIKKAWHEVEFKAIMDSAAAQTDRELKPQINRLLKVPK